jgi:hypothetical protein
MEGSMHPQLEQIADEFHSARARLHALSAAVPDPLWTIRPDADRWSIAECVAHLNLTADHFLPALEAALERARQLGPVTPRRYRHDLLGWLLWRIMPPPVRMRVSTSRPFVPAEAALPAALRTHFERTQTAQLLLLRQADGLPIDRVRIASPFQSRMKYSAYSAFSILPRHQHRHLWQAEQVAQQLQSGAIMPSAG